MAYGQEMILDLYGCDPATFNRESIEEWLIKLCEMIDMQREDLHWWDYEGVPEEDIPMKPHLRGTSVVQFISTSNIVVHTLDLLGEVYINLFSCKKFDGEIAAIFTKNWFRSDSFEKRILERGKFSKAKI